MIANIDGDVMLYQSAWGRTQRQAEAHIKTLIEWAVEDTFASDYNIAIGSEHNFRDEFFPFYKKSNSRSNSKTVLQDWFHELKPYMATLPNVVQCVGFEADDLLRIWGGQCKRAGIDFVTCSIDKDLDAIPGLHYTSKTRETYTVTPAYADRFFWYQCLIGDGVDNIPGIPGVGPKTADKILGDNTTWAGCRLAVINQYKEKYKDEWWDYLMSNARLLHIWRSNHDHFILKKADFETVT